MILLVGTGLWLTFSLRALQFSHLIHAFTLIVRKTPDRKAQGDISNFEALMVALSATVGTGNIAGVATAIYIGGPGALFWMWMTGLVGMATKYAEAVLAVKYRVQNENGTFSGGPMYYISRGLGWKWLATLFAFFAAIATFGIGSMVQSNSVADALNHSFSIAPGITGIVLMGLTAAVIIGGVRSIGRVTALLVPVMIALYVLGALAVILMHITEIPGVLAMVVSSAFQPVAATGGFAGATVMMAIRLGVARGLFSNESGLGSAPIAAAAARTSQPVVQALISMTQTFIDTLVVCSMTGLVILVTGVWTSGKNGAPLTSYAFETGLPGELGGLILTNFEVHDFKTGKDNFDAFYYGQDFGYNHADAILGVGWKDGEVYICSEIYVFDKDTEEIISLAKQNKVDQRVEMFCDSAEPDRIKTWSKAGFRAYPVKKEPGSVKAQIDWLKGRKIHIHPSCVNVLKEVQQWKWKKDPTSGLYIDEPVEFMDDAMAALRYSVERLRRGSSIEVLK